MPAIARDTTFSLTLTACAHPVQVLAFSGDEAISSPFSFDVELVCDRADLDLEALLHTSAFLGFDRQGHGIHGQIYRIAHSGFIPLKFHDQIMEMVLEYQVSKLSNKDNTHTSDKVEQYIDLSAMNLWLDHIAPAHFYLLKQRHEALYADRGVSLLRHHSGTWFVDYHDSEHR